MNFIISNNSNSEKLHELNLTLFGTHFGSSQISPDSWPDQNLNKMRAILPLDALKDLVQIFLFFDLVSRLVATAFCNCHETGGVSVSGLSSHWVMRTIVEYYVHDVLLVGCSDLSHCSHVHYCAAVSVKAIYLFNKDLIRIFTFLEDFCIAIPKAIELAWPILPTHKKSFFHT
jgi:hypothetical protein